MRLYGSVEIPVSDEPVDRLTLGDEAIVSDGAFTVAVDAGVLALEPASDCETWTFSAKALKTLGKSGIDTLVLYVNEQQIEIPTALKMQGLVYASLSARGIVSKDYVFTVSGSGIEAAVDGERYRLSADYELTGG